MFKNRLLPKLRVGDVLAVMDAGAYFSSYSSNFAFPRPAILMVEEGVETILRNAETFEHLTAMDADLTPVDWVVTRGFLRAGTGSRDFGEETA
jgi:diaminopimelate decarboxylase